MIRHYIIYGNAKEPKQNLSQQWVADNASAWLVVEENNRHRTIQSYHNKASCAWLAVEENNRRELNNRIAREPRQNLSQQWVANIATA